LPSDVLAELKRIADDKVDLMIGDDPLYQRIHASYHQYRQNVMNYNELSERALLNVRAEIEGY
jgi:TRAP-type mannitol/chloroaromatic compound transport system substrate-binding protein